MFGFFGVVGKGLVLMFVSVVKGELFDCGDVFDVGNLFELFE